LTISQALGLGALQGVTEFLPVSSSGHLVLARELLGIREPVMEFVVLVHAGSLLAILVYFWREIVSVFTTRRHLIPWLIVGSVPAALAYAAFDKLIEETFESPLVVGLGMLFTGAVLLVCERRARDERSLGNVTWQDALFIGVAQAIALLPGVSRSGMTVGSGLFRGLERGAAVAFAFLLGSIAVGGATLLKCRHFGSAEAMGGWAPALGGFAMSGMVSLLALSLLTWLVRRKSLAVCAIYCFLVGSAVVLAKLTGLW
jgi:undecaprenyl-diphosphatase